MSTPTKEPLPPALASMRSQGMRITEARRHVFKVLEHAHRPVPIDVIHAELGTQSFDLVTLYRNLNAFEEAGVLQVVRDENGKALYELVKKDGHHHHHVICRGCGRIDCLDVCDIAPFESAAERLGYSIDSHRVDLYGLCGECSKS